MLPDKTFRAVHALLLCLSLMALTCTGLAQFPGFQEPQGERVDADAALDRALKSSSLTFAGKPFHAVMEISSDAKEYSGRVEVWWVNETKYRLVVSSPKFDQEKIVNGVRVFEKDGDYYPRWLENFVDAILDPVPVAKNFRGRGGAVMLGPSMSSCLRRDDRPGNITDELTWGMVCFKGNDPEISSVLTMNVSIEYSDWKGFGKKKIARTYKTDVLAFEPVTGHLTTLEEWKQPDDPMFSIAAETPPGDRISTEFVSTLKEESMVEHAPVIEWPSVREGKTEGYMIVYARTDRTGQVRETAKHNSDQPGLESFGMEQALKFKFKPLVVNGVAEQMEMPLVLHFTSHLDNPIPILTVEQMKKQIVDCNVNYKPGTKVGLMRISVNEQGVRVGIGSTPGSPTQKGWTAGPQAFMAAMKSLEPCHFLPYLVDGKATFYKGDVEVAVP
jgi:hypothetical protein